jgi:hypothetical protein
LRPSSYQKGIYVQGTLTWVQNPSTVPPCPNEDLNFNGILDPGEDLNSNSRLDPGNVASVNGSAVTDASGFATATLSYAKDYATWAQVILEGRAGVVGNDPPFTTTFFLPGAASDYNVLTVPPPGVTSPFGVGTLCTDTK